MTEKARVSDARRAKRTRRALCHEDERRLATAGAQHAPCGVGVSPVATRRVGAVYEKRARTCLERGGLIHVASNVAVRGGELDLVMHDRDGTLVFVEVRARAGDQYGGAAASVGPLKRRRIAHAARWVWARDGGRSACRFDVVAFDGTRITWIRDAFRMDDA